VATLAIAAACLSQARATGDKPDKQGRHHIHVIIAKVDTQKDTITVKWMDRNGKEQEKTFQLSKDVSYRDGTGKALKLSDFRANDDVLIIHKADTVAEVKKDERVTITRVDAKAGKVTVKMKDQNGREVEKTLQLAEDAEYIDSTGRVAALTVFRAGDQVLIIEVEGKLRGLQKAPAPR
jgi:uncharacterized protein YigE (DUF2233 family)